jgi:hypothetical protein
MSISSIRERERIMNSKQKIITIVILLLLVSVGLVFFDKMVVHKNNHIPLSDDLTEVYYDDIIEDLVNGEPFLERKTLLLSENIAKEYARILYLENFGEWNAELELWVKHYENYGVWLAMLRTSEPSLTGPPVIVFQDSDGRVIMYSR